MPWSFDTSPHAITSHAGGPNARRDHAPFCGSDSGIRPARRPPTIFDGCTAAGPHSSETSGVEVQITCLVKNALVLRSASELATRSASSTSPLYLCWIRRPLYGAPTGLNLRIAAQFGTSRSENMRTAVQQHLEPSPYAASHPGRTSHRGPQDKTP